MNRKSVIFLTGAAFLSLGLFCANGNVGHSQEERTVIEKGISVNGRDLSGKSVSEANAIIDDMVKEQSSSVFTLKAGSKSIRATGEELGLVAADPQLAQRALNFGQDGNILYRFKANTQLASGQGKDFDLKYSVDDAKVKEYLSAHEDEIVSTAVDGTLTRSNGSFTYVPGKEGHRLVLDKSLSTAQEKMSLQIMFRANGTAHPEA